MTIEVDPLLGRPLANYPSDRLRPLLLAALVCAAVSVLLNFTLATVTEWWGPTLTMLIMALLVLGFGWYILHVWNREVVLYEHGFSYREGSTTVFLIYTEIKSIRQRAERLRYFGVVRRAVYSTTVRTVRDEVITLTSIYRHIDQLGLRLETQFNVVRRPVTEHLLRQGETVAFGGLVALSAKGVIAGDRTLTWAEFGGFRVQGGKLILLANPDSEWGSVPLNEIDNVLLLLDLLRVGQQTKTLGAMS